MKVSFNILLQTLHWPTFFLVPVLESLTECLGSSNSEAECLGSNSGAECLGSNSEAECLGRNSEAEFLGSN
jgi:hypothetical protein